MKKKGSHVGMMISFLVFITFIAFLYSILEPSLKVNNDKDFLLNHLETEILENCSGEMASITVINNSQSSYDCLKIDISPTGLNLTGSRLIVKDKDNTNVHYGYFGNTLWIENNTNKLFKIYSSEFITPQNSTVNCPVNSTNYTIGLFRTEKYIFGKKIKNLISEINSNYEDVKDQFNVPPGGEFGLEFVDSKGTVTRTLEKNVSIDIFVNEVPINYIDNQTNLVSGFINIKVW
ncbi:MAG: hypothetical protein ABIB79_04515 [archaeon]